MKQEQNSNQFSQPFSCFKFPLTFVTRKTRRRAARHRTALRSSLNVATQTLKMLFAIKPTISGNDL